MSKIIIKNTKYADSRTADEEITKEKLYEATAEHLKDVERGMDFISKLIHEAGLKHDYTKMDAFDQYAEDVLRALPEEEFIKQDWNQRHIFEERHHLNSNVPLDVNLVDVIEMIVDCVMAGRGRAGHLTHKYLKLQDPTVLERAYWNTVKLLDDVVVVSDSEELNVGE